MRYRDAVHGHVEITEPMLLELLNSSTLTRLHGVSLVVFCVLSSFRLLVIDSVSSSTFRLQVF